MLRLKLYALAVAAASLASAGWAALWTFPSMLFSAFLVAWGAEAAQFLISQGLALAILAWLQTMPEFAVEAVIAWEAGKDPASCFIGAPTVGCHSHLAIANFTGAIRLLIGLGWPMIYFVAAWFRRRDGDALGHIALEDGHSIGVMATVPPLAYFGWVWYKGSLSLIDGVVLLAMYVGYLALLWRMPAEGADSVTDAPRVARWAYARPGWQRPATIGGLFLLGGIIMYVTAHPFLDSMLALAVSAGISQFVFVQWVAPFVSEFPEKVSAFHWASRRGRAPMALMNMLSSNVNQWTVLAAMIPLVLSWSRGAPSALPFDGPQRQEILLTLLQSAVAVLVLARLRFEWWSAALLFLTWLIGFVIAEWRDEMCVVYSVWAVVVMVSWVWRRPTVLQAFWRTVHSR
ncbi:MAG: sodium:calcium antiporter [Gemmatimonadota bacterium]|nr:sodium:calcium antiporter [Gemmatimonadota bacterium]